jgi:predicted TIM-barrel fold metal-dependent hydrolase
VDTAFSLGRIAPAPGVARWQGRDAEMLSGERFCALAEKYGADKVLFGTDSPWTDPIEEIERIKALPLPEETIQGILGGNAQKLLGTD